MLVAAVKALSLAVAASLEFVEEAMVACFDSALRLVASKREH